MMTDRRSVGTAESSAWARLTDSRSALIGQGENESALKPLCWGQKPATARVYEWSRGPEETAAEEETPTGWTEISVAER